MSRGALRITVGTVILVAWCTVHELVTARGNLWAIHDAMTGGVRDTVVRNEARFSAIRRDLPENRAVGYVSDRPRAEPKALFLEGFVQAQSALAPHLALDTDTLTPIVGDFPNGPPDSVRLAAMGLRTVRDYGHGVLLLTRSAQ